MIYEGEEAAWRAKGFNSKKKNKGTFGVRSAFRWLRMNGWLKDYNGIREEAYRDIINTINDWYIERLKAGYEVKFPTGILKLWLIEADSEAVYPKLRRIIDWTSTKQLWREDDESRNNHVKVLYEEGGCRVFSWVNRKPKNFEYYTFIPARKFTNCCIKNNDLQLKIFSAI